MKWMTRKRLSLALQVLTVLCIIVALFAGFCLMGEMTDVYMLNGRIYTLPIEEQASVWQHAVSELVDDGIEYGLIAAGALVVALLSAAGSLVAVCCSKSQQH